MRHRHRHDEAVGVAKAMVWLAGMLAIGGGAVYAICTLMIGMLGGGV